MLPPRPAIPSSRALPRTQGVSPVSGTDQHEERQSMGSRVGGMASDRRKGDVPAMNRNVSRRFCSLKENDRKMWKLQLKY